MQSELKLGLDFLVRGKIVVLEGTGHPRILEALVGHWKSRTMQEIEVSREGVTRKIVAPGGSVYEVSMLTLFEKGSFSEEKGLVLEQARDATLLAVSQLGFEVPNAYRKETVQALIKGRLETIRRWKVKSGNDRSPLDPPLPCAILGVDGPPGTLRTRYGDDLSRAVGEVGVFIETP